jgi:AraC-like DNA-binding protein
LLVAEAGPGGVASSEIVAAPLREAVLHGLLQVVDHPYREALDAPAPSFGPAALRRVVDAVEADPARDLTLTDMARIAAVSVRTLQELYRRHLDTTPTEHLRRTRLARAQRQLRTSDPTETTVTAVARRWGFVHTGRFARTYRARYEESPSATLRRTDWVLTLAWLILEVYFSDLVNASVVVSRGSSAPTSSLARCLINVRMPPA